MPKKCRNKSFFDLKICIYQKNDLTLQRFSVINSKIELQYESICLLVSDRSDRLPSH